jgi:hypothetical protein
MFATDGASEKSQPWPWVSPYVDVFFYNVSRGHIQEVDTFGRVTVNTKTRFETMAFFPLVPYYFAGFYMHGPSTEVALQRYDLSVCKLPVWNHHIDHSVRIGAGGLNSTDLDCCELSESLPFLNMNSMVLANGRHSLQLPRFDTPTPLQLISPLTREDLHAEADAKGQELTSQIENLDEVEIDNSLSANKCNFTALRVVEFNMDRGKRWLEFASLLESEDSVDIIILNEMDFGMTRSNQQHTTRLLAQKLGFNYAWGLEFVELTRGTREEQNVVTTGVDFYGLHGNAVLSRCRITNAQIMRDPIGMYFSSKKLALNAHGFEKRLGGRMALLTKIQIGEYSVNVGSLHKVDSETVFEKIQKYIGGHNHRSIIGGDQSSHICELLHLEELSRENTWPASCDTLGREKGDILCTNFASNDSVTMRPCLRSEVSSIKLSDHGIIKSTLLL